MVESTGRALSTYERSTCLHAMAAIFARSRWSSVSFWSASLARRPVCVRCLWRSLEGCDNRPNARAMIQHHGATELLPAPTATINFGKWRCTRKWPRLSHSEML
jgi:hypothetical protein